MAPHDHQHLTTEQISAFLDKQLSAQEQAEFNAHLQACQQCQQVLADLKQTVALLHALPQPALPRSFVLPASQTAQTAQTIMTQRQEQRRQHVHPITTTTRRIRTHRAGHFARQSVRVLSSIAAIIGIVFILSSYLASVQHGGSTASTNSSAGTTNSPATEQPRISPHATPDKGASGVPCDQASPAPVPCGARTPGTTTPTQKPTVTEPGNGTPQVGPPANQVHSPPIDLNSPQVHLGLGAVLLLIGILGVVLTRKRRE